MKPEAKPTLRESVKGFVIFLGLAAAAPVLWVALVWLVVHVATLVGWGVVAALRATGAL
jgi:hypothetical protein